MSFDGHVQPLHLVCARDAESSPLMAAQQSLPESGPQYADAPNMVAEQPVEADEGRDIGHVKWPVYMAYMKAVGVGMAAFVLLSITLMQVCA